MTGTPEQLEPAIDHTDKWLDLHPGLWEILKKIPHPFYPEVKNVFRAFSFFPPEHTRVVIVGQDPYHHEGKASGLAFGYHTDYRGAVNSSLANILTEVNRTEGRGETRTSNVREVVDTTLESWARQGVLLINSKLTVAPEKPMSHAGLGWEEEIQAVLYRLTYNDTKPRVFMLWGREAQETYRRATSLGGDDMVPRKLVLRTSHPCRYSVSRGFEGCGHFRKANDFLSMQYGEEIDWLRGDN